MAHPAQRLHQLTHHELVEIFTRWQQFIAPRARLPRAIQVVFYPYVGINNTIRLRDGVMHVRLSDMLTQAPTPIIEAVAGILLARLFRKAVPARCTELFREYVRSKPVMRMAEQRRRERGFKLVSGARGRHYDLERLFQYLNRRYFDGRLAHPALTWSQRRTRRTFGHYDAAHHTIVISRTLDDGRVPQMVVEYVLYHEMLHIKHGVTHINGRRCVHTPAFQEDERQFESYDLASAWLCRLAEALSVTRRSSKPRTRSRLPD
ncbi:MAG: SprT-like domain-containing protein [Chloracidobacterium sp.]|uniref:SprT-like domain-containing protein n=1 Tax=Chloracidobacterium validum TaxID=2821543 RepID=A0ABX8B986_9BACT|nr:SprT-like domain-containing protein [Chloracidobacterium validum]QUW03002.1 SprT-like domain-containing protein [Chloracidobacterium validum]